MAPKCLNCYEMELALAASRLRAAARYLSKVSPKGSYTNARQGPPANRALLQAAIVYAQTVERGKK